MPIAVTVDDALHPFLQRLLDLRGSATVLVVGRSGSGKSFLSDSIYATAQEPHPMYVSEMQYFYGHAHRSVDFRRHFPEFICYLRGGNDTSWQSNCRQLLEHYNYSGVQLIINRLAIMPPHSFICLDFETGDLTFYAPVTI